MMKKDYADKSWVHQDLDAHWHEHEVNTYVKIGRLTLIASVLAGMLISLGLLIISTTNADSGVTTTTEYEVSE
jgi:urea transporter